MSQVIRKCISCGAAKEKKSLWRIISRPSGGPALDKAQMLPGRGAYLCKNETCVESGLKGKRPRILHALKMKDPTADLTSLAESLRADSGQETDKKGGHE